MLGELGNNVAPYYLTSCYIDPTLGEFYLTSTSELQMVFEARELSRRMTPMDPYPPTTTPSAVQQGGLYGPSVTPTARICRQRSTATFLVVHVG